jgi:hypothetical protein
LHPKGLEIVTVALDTAGPEAARPFIEAAKAEHPSLIDAAHEVDAKLGVVNVPNSVWIDEDGVIVRPAEPAYTGIRAAGLDFSSMKTEGLPPVLAETLEEAKKIRTHPDEYVAALRDWVNKGSSSIYALSPDEVIARSDPRPPEVAQAAAAFELGQHLHRTGHHEDAIPWLAMAHKLQPDNWTYKRQSWIFEDPFQGPTDVYEGNWLADVKKIGAENYYPAFRP